MPSAPEDVVYGIARIDSSGRIYERAIITALGWAGGDRLTFTADAGVVTARREPGSMVTLPASGYITIPAALRRRCGLEAGDQVLLAALPDQDSPAGSMTRRVGRTGKLRLRLPAGLADGSLLLRSDDDWLDYRYFHAPIPGRQQDPSVVWDQPGAEISILPAGGEGPHVEFKREISANPESRKKMLKTAAAFASGEGGTVVFGVSDDAQPVGIGSGTLDQHKLAVASMIRDSITPEPPYRLRAAEVDGHLLLLAEISAGGQWYALNPAKPEFYVRRGASTVPARMDEITAGFSRKPPAGGIRF